MNANSPHYFERITNEDGLNQNTIGSLHQDKFGFIWMGTPNGLIKYDGNSFMTYHHHTDDKNSILGNSVNFFHDDYKGNMWLFTEKGFCSYSYSTNQFHELKTLNKYISKEELVVNVFPINDSKKLVFTNSKIICYDTQNKTVSIQNININKAFGIQKVIKKDNRFFILSESKIIIANLLEDNHLNWQDVIDKRDMGAFTFKDICINEKENLLYLSANKNIFVFDLKWEKVKLQKTILLKLKSLDGYFNKKLFYNGKNNLWVVLEGKGIVNYNLKTTETIHYQSSNHKNSLSSNVINDILIDKTGLVWIATGLGGISIYNPYKQPFYTISKTLPKLTGLTSNHIQQILIDSYEHLWVGTSKNGLNINTQPFNLKSLEDIKFRKLFADQAILCLKEINQQVFVGTPQGLLIFDSKSQRLIYNSHEKNIPIKAVNAIEEVNGNVIIHSNHQLYTIILNHKKVVSDQVLQITALENLEKLKTAKIYQIYNDQEKGILIGTNKGLFHLDQQLKNLTHYFSLKRNQNTLADDRISAIYRSENKVLWIGTFGGGLHKCIEKDERIIRFEQISTQNGLPDNIINAILEDKNNNLWLSTNAGIVQFDPNKQSFKIYTITDGLVSNSFQKGAYDKDKYGTILMGSKKGIVVFNPLEIKNIPISYNPQILELRVNNEEIIPHHVYDDKVILNNPIYDVSSITLPYDMNQISFELGAIYYGDKNNTNFTYRLTGIDNEWVIQKSTQKDVSYNSLPPGEYMFEVKGDNVEGLENMGIKQLKIFIESPWYTSVYAIIIYVIITFLLFFSLYRYFSNMIVLQKKVLAEKKDKEHLQEINEAKLTFFTNVSHELRTPLTLILSPLEQLADDNRLAPELKTFVDKININGKRLLNLTNSLINFRQMDKGKMEINLIHQDIIPFIKKTADAFNEYSIDKKINYVVAIEKESISGWFDKAVLERIIFNILSNAFKYTEKNGEVVFSVDQIDEQLVIVVEDTGIGIKEEDMHFIFERFYKSDNHDTMFESSGIGLYLVKELLELHKGDIDVKSRIHEGTTFTITIPVQKENEEIALPVSNLTTDKNKVNYENNDATKILVVEDNPEIRELIYDLFHHKYQIYTANDGIEGYEVAQKVHPDLLILDVNMPKMNGYELADKLKENSTTNPIPIIFLTAMLDLNSKKKVMEKGAQLHMGKPFSPSILELQINNLLNRKLEKAEKIKIDINENEGNATGLLSEDEQWLAKVKNVLEENYKDSNFNVNQIASKLDMTYLQFYLQFKKITGAKASEYLRDYRLKKAIHLLDNDKSISVAEVMYEVGFNNASYFSTKFKAKYKVTPSEYRKGK
ncbi:response regulator [Flammeovirga sp. EKP202]|nr:response regulator [Flammeovirga sp. EKP202]